MRRRLLAISAALAILTGGLVVSPAVADTPATVTGTASRSGSSNKSGIVVRFFRWTSATTYNSVATTSATTATSGVYSVSLPAGTYSIYAGDTNASSAYAEEYGGESAALRFASTFTVVAGENSTGHDIALDLGGTITGHVVAGPSKTPLANAYIVPRMKVGSEIAATGHNVYTNASGDFTIPAIKAAYYAIEIDASGYTTEYYSDFSQQTDAEAVPVYGNGSTVSLKVWMNSFQASRTFFQDVPLASSFSTAISWMGTAGISTGTPVDYERPLYKPTDMVSRQAMASFLKKVAGDTTYVAPYNASFADVPVVSQFFLPIEWMKAQGITSGTPQPSGLPLFKPADSVSRQAMAQFLFRLSGEEDFFHSDGPATFADVPMSSSYFQAVEWMAYRDISTGTPQPSGLPLFKPSDPVSRQSMALFLYRYTHSAS